VRTFNLWMQENGFRTDQVLLTQDANYHGVWGYAISIHSIYPQACWEWIKRSFRPLRATVT
jgi:hypothetical protein